MIPRGTRSNQEKPMHTAGVILCGGQSSRMGRPKAWLPVGGETMLARVVRLLGGVVSPLVVVAAPEQELPPLAEDILVVRDPVRGRGPLVGIAAGLAALAGRADAAYVSACDVPLLRAAFVRRMVELLDGHAACVPEVGGYRHPLAAVYRVEIAAVAAELLAADRLRPAFLFERADTRVVRAEDFADVDPDGESLRNVNTPEEYEAAMTALGSG
jgi:molybdopterin-guanine dinucleotide biosynthesis protein A